MVNPALEKLLLRFDCCIQDQDLNSKVMAYRKTKLDVPDYTLIPGGLNIGSQIIVRGRVPYGENRFHINLQNDIEDGCDVAFHFNPRTDSQTVVRNSYQGGWQNEELDIPFFPFSNGSKFTIRIYVRADAYIVLVNGAYFLEYSHRLSYQDVRYMKLSEGAEYYESTVQNACHVPYKGEFPGGLKMGKALRVRGFVNDNAERFAINFNADYDGDTVGIHFNPRQDQEDVVLNSKVGGWQEEERGQGWFPFKRGDFFDVLFISWDGRFMIYVNGKYFTAYTFRIPPEDVRYLDINGDVTLMDVEFTDPLPGDYIKTIPSGLDKSDLIVIKGFFYPEGQRFAVNLLYGTSLDDDIALHFNPRRDQGEVVLNSREGGAWEEEERHSLPHPMVEMLPFEVEIVNKSKKFKIYINGKKFTSFKARGNVEDIKGINVNGEAYIYEVKLLRRVDRPFVDRLPGVLESGSWVSIIGTPKKNADRFAINLQCGDDPDYGNDVAFHFNPRFSGQDSIRNTLENGSWGGEEKEQPNFPFEPEDRFEINILRLPDVFRVFVNHKFYIDYAHRIDPSRICHIMLTGDCNFFEPEFY
ncbi:galactokinase [Biomphalaria glabrata]|nr:32 kDa beta-galactoside-binding lectin-like [Biomphalaria glabrata]